MTGLSVAPSDDVDLLAAIHRETVAVAYASFFPVGQALPSPDEFQTIWAERVVGAGVRAFIATSDGRPVGLAATGPGAGCDVEAELVGLYVLLDRWRSGIGGVLESAALGQLRREARTRVGAWVIEANTGARRFYERHGWALVPGVTAEPYAGVLEVRYQRHLQP